MNEETLPNGIYVHWQRDSTNHYGDESFYDPWLASIRIGGWHYCQGGQTKENAIANLFRYMKDMKVQFDEDLKRQETRLAELNKFIETEVS